jgi:hypothetical protein
MDQKLSDDSIRCGSQIRTLFKLLLSITENEKNCDVGASSRMA